MAVSLRSFEDRWLWLRGQFEDDAATLTALAEGTADPSRAPRLHGKAEYARTALDLMNQADRNGPVEPL